jgi:hypothetical protein
METIGGLLFVFGFSAQNNIWKTEKVSVNVSADRKSDDYLDRLQKLITGLARVCFRKAFMRSVRFSISEYSGSARALI